MGKKYTFKKMFPFILAILLSGAVVFFALNYENVFSKKKSGQEHVLSNEDWANSLKVITTSPTSTFATVERGLMGVDTATTTTDKISRDLLMEYAFSQKARSGEALSDMEIQSITNKLLQKAQEGTRNPYTASDITAVKDSLEASQKYFQTLNQLIAKFYSGYTVNESIFVVKALNDQDPSILEPLASHIERYKKLEQSLLAIKTPQSLSANHLQLVNAYASVRIAIEGMYGIFNDPIKGMSAIPAYSQALNDLLVIANKYQTLTVPKN